MSPCLVSIVLPVFNAASTVIRAVESLSAQSLADWELLAVDDGSTDDSLHLLQAIARTDSRMQVIAQPHSGVVSAHNTGLAAARGAFIARMDADDESLPDRLKAQVEFLQAHQDVGMVGSLVEFGGNREQQAGYAQHVDWLNSVVSPEEIELNRFVEMPLANPSLMFRRELVAAHGTYRDGDFPEDYEFVLRWLEAGVRMAKVPQVLLRWNDPPTRLTRRDPRYRPEAFYRTKAAYLARWLKRNANDERLLLAWGAGRLTRRRIEMLEAEGVRVAGFIDIDPHKLGPRRDGREVISPEQIPPAGECFVLGYVGKRGARELAREHLRKRGFIEGRDFLMAA